MTRTALILLVSCLAACGGDKGTVKCDVGPYLAAARAPKVEAPDGLDNLDPLDEMPLPAASPQPPRPDDGTCLEQPPQIIRMN